MDRTAFEPARSFKHGSQSSEARVRNGKYEIVTAGFHTNVEPYQVERVIGHEPVRQYLTAATGGRWQAHEAAYDPKANEWFDVYGGEDRKPGEWGHWTGGGMNWNTRCAACHNTRLQKNYDEATDSYHTAMAEMSVGCEACHGPFKAHVAWRKAHPGGQLKEPAMARPDSRQMMETCGSCHSRRDELTGDFKPGDSFYDHYSLEILDSVEQWYPDGQVKDEDYEYASFLSSRMHQSGVSCLDCHDAHTMKLRAQGNDLCLRCHNGSFARAPIIQPAEHTHHKPGGKGNECISCHMPVTVYMQRHERRDHGFTIPDPLLTKELDIPNACNRCHADKSADWARENTEKWYGAKMNRHTRERAEWIGAAQRGEAAAKERLTGLVKDGTESPYWRAVAAGLLWRWVDDPVVNIALLTALKDEHPLVREKAVQSLEASDRPEISLALKTMLNDPSRSVRIADAWALRATPDVPGSAERDLQLALDYEADQPRGQFRKARLELARQHPSESLNHLRKGIAQDPFSPPLRYELGVVLQQSGQTNEALDAFDYAETMTPGDPRIPFARARILAKAQRFSEARNALNKTLKLQPDFKPARELLQKLPSDR